MSSKEVSAIAIKIFGIWLLVNVVMYSPTMILTLTRLEMDAEQQFSPTIYYWVTGAFLVVGIACSMALFRAANSILSNSGLSNESDINISQRFLLQIVGVYFSVTAFSSLPGMGIRFFKENDIALSNYLYFAGYIFQLCVGLYLLIKPTVWAQWLAKLRGRA